MERLSKLVIILMVPLVLWSDPLTCRAQAPTPPTPPSAAGSAPAVSRPLADSQPRQMPNPTASPSRTESEVPSASPAVGAGAGERGGTCRPRCRRRRARSAPTAGLDQTFKLKAAPLESTDLRFPINLATALRLSDARPLIVAAAQASVWVAEAELTRAKVLWVPHAQHRLRLSPARRRRP